MASRKKSERKPSDEEKKTKFNVTDKIPAFALSGAKRNKNFIKLQQDLVERTRNEKNNKESRVAETLYVDATRNVGVVLGEIQARCHI